MTRTEIRQPVYTTMARALRENIESGALGRGDRVPSEQSLMEQWHCSRGTVRQALGELVAEGLIVSQRGRGHFVRAPVRLTWMASEPERNDASVTPADTWSRSVRSQGYAPSERITMEIVRADERVAEWLSLSAGEAVSVRRRLRLVDDEPYSIADSFYPRSIVAGTEIELPDDITPGVYAVFARLGRAWVRTVDTWISRAPTRHEADTLTIPRGISVAEVVRVSYDADQAPVRVTTFILPGDRHTITYEHREALT